MLKWRNPITLFCYVHKLLIFTQCLYLLCGSVFSVEESYHPILPPVGLKTHVLSSSTIVLTWTDTSLGLNQMVPDNRFYTVRYRLESDSSKENSRSVVVRQLVLALHRPVLFLIRQLQAKKFHTGFKKQFIILFNSDRCLAY